ncbi:Nif3-like dinuclear metal center hexameric protein [Psychrobacter sp. HD31]|uniref:Nif3-like dinuclear metal center hexameric protein n=1 Tax=Psychrobacter sp. HD31 TaxID=3112003 RepID=UPI003DA1EA31
MSHYLSPQQLQAWCNDYLLANEFKDYCPNGLQVDAAVDIKKIITGVTASEALIDKAIKKNANAILVHHGYFWKGEDQCIVGMKGNRIRKLLQNGISLFAYHLPLDAHQEIGNNAQLAKLLQLENSEPLYPQEKHPIGNIYSAQNLSPTKLIKTITQALNREPLHIDAGNESLNRIAICTGAAQDMIEQAAQMNCDAFISGEISERTTHLARELGVDYFACGHHATEIGGIKALGELINQRLDIDVEFVDINNPV